MKGSMFFTKQEKKEVLRKLGEGMGDYGVHEVCVHIALVFSVPTAETKLNLYVWNKIITTYGTFND
jgi:hypothetical protein